MRVITSIRLQTDPPAGVSGAPTDNNIMLWNAVIFGFVISRVLYFKSGISVKFFYEAVKVLQFSLVGLLCLSVQYFFKYRILSIK